MPGQIELPVWSVAVLAALALVAILDRLVLPLVRRLRHGARRRRLEALNTRLRLPVSPFKLAARRSVIEQLLREPEVEQAIQATAAAEGRTTDAVRRRAKAYAREIVPAFSATAYFRVGTRLARRLSQFLYRVRLVAVDEAALAGIDPGATVVFVMNHRSNLDYVLVTYLAADSVALSYAVGEWARVPGLAGLIRAMGAYFIRRDSRDPLYRRVLATYVQLATRAGVAQAVFPEGGLSRTGGLQAAKLGLLGYICQAHEMAGARDVVFVPVGLNYDRVLEDRVLMAAAATTKGERPRFRVRVSLLAGFIARNIAGRIGGTRHRYGYACVSVGRPVSLRRHCADRGIGELRLLGEDERFAEVERIGNRLMAEIGRAVPVLPVALVAFAMLEGASEGRTEAEVVMAARDLASRLWRSGATIYTPRSDETYTIEFGLRLLLARRLLRSHDGVITIVEAERPALAFYANSLVHHLCLPPWPVVDRRDDPA